MGREKQPEIGRLSRRYTPRPIKPKLTWSQKWEARAKKGLPGPPPGIPVGRAGGGTEPAALGDLDEGKLFPHQLWTKQHEAKSRLGLLGKQGKPTLRGRFFPMDKVIKPLLKTRVGHEALTTEGEIERQRREGPVHGAGMQQLRLPRNPEEERKLDNHMREQVRLIREAAVRRAIKREEMLRRTTS